MRTMHRRKLCFYYLIMASCAVTVFFVALSCVISMDHHHHSGDHYHRIQSAYGESMPSSHVDSFTASALQQGHPFPSISRYCSIQVPPQHGIDEVAQHLSLIHVAITIRHGDRSSIHSIPNSSIPVRLDHSSLRNNMTLLNDTALLYSPHLRHFELKRMPSTAATDGALKGEDLSLSLDPSTAFRVPDYSLSPGQLTSRGFMQHIQLGQLLRSQYGAPLLDHIRSPQQLYVRSTNYIRTIRSVSALLTALLPQVTTDFKQKLGISYFENEMDECMHGIGEHGSSHSVKSHNSTLGPGIIPQETVATGTCGRAVSLSRRQRRSFSEDERVTERVTSLFGRVKKSIPELLDASLPNLCHQLPLPCSSDMVHCLQEEDVQLMLAESDRYYCDRFAGIHGGLNSTRLAMYPFMKEIADHLVRAAVHDRDDNAAEKLSVFSGHDTVIAPVLAALGVYSGALCYWPPYASRIVFELYRHSPPNDSTVEAGVWAGASTGLLQLYPHSDSTNSVVEPAAFSPQQKSLYSRAFVRILFNGQEITEGVPACSEGPSPASQHVLTAGRMCPLDSYLRQVHSLLAPHRGLDGACQNSS